jgi:hypothetical protein
MQGKWTHKNSDGKDKDLVASSGGGSGDLLSTNNLSDLANASTARNNLGLGNVNNTADSAKPVSTLQAAADATVLSTAESYADGLIASLKLGSPLTLDTLDEIATALNDDPNFATTILTSLGNRLRVDTNAQGLNSTEKTNAKTNLGLENVPNLDTSTTANITDSSNKRLLTDSQEAIVDATSGTNTGDNSANTRYSGLCGIYRMCLQATGSHIAGRTANTYFIPLADALGVTGVGTLYAPAIIRIDSADYPTIDGLAPKFRIKWSLMVNNVAPAGTFTIGLYPITRPAASGGAGVDIYTMGTVVSGSNGSSFTTPVADSMNNGVSADFALPDDGYYVLGIVTTATIATSSHLHINAQLQVHNA